MVRAARPDRPRLEQTRRVDTATVDGRLKPLQSKMIGLDVATGGLGWSASASLRARGRARIDAMRRVGVEEGRGIPVGVCRTVHLARAADPADALCEKPSRSAPVP